MKIFAINIKQTKEKKEMQINTKQDSEHTQKQIRREGKRERREARERVWESFTSHKCFKLMGDTKTCYDLGPKGNL